MICSHPVTHLIADHLQQCLTSIIEMKDDLILPLQLLCGFVCGIYVVIPSKVTVVCITIYDIVYFP